jgi:hypothetical protein
MTGRAHPGVDAYLAQLPAWQRSICEQLRELVWETDAEIEETIKRTVQPYFVLHGNATARAIQVYEGDEIDRVAIIGILAEIVDHNRRGGWRRLSRP